MSIPRGASLETVLQTFEDPNFVAHAAIDLNCGRNAGLDSAYTANAELLAQLDAYSQLLAQETSRSLRDLQKSEKRTKVQYDLLKNDLLTLARNQAIISQEIKALSARDAPQLEELAALDAKRQKIIAVLELLEQASTGEDGNMTAEVASVFAGTSKEKKMKELLKKQS